MYDLETLSCHRDRFPLPPNGLTIFVGLTIGLISIYGNMILLLGFM